MHQNHFKVPSLPSLSGGIRRALLSSPNTTRLMQTMNFSMDILFNPLIIVMQKVLSLMSRTLLVRRIVRTESKE